MIAVLLRSEAQSYGGYGGNLGGYALGGAYSNFAGNCTPMYSSSYGGRSYGSGSYGGSGYGSSYSYGTTTPRPIDLSNCGYDADAQKVFGYYGYDFPKPPIGLSYPNIGWPYSIPYPYYTP